MEQGIGALRQSQTPRTAEFEVEQQSAAETNLVEHFGKDVHDADASPPHDRTQ